MTQDQDDDNERVYLGFDLKVSLQLLSVFIGVSTDFG